MPRASRTLDLRAVAIPTYPSTNDRISYFEKRGEPKKRPKKIWIPKPQKKGRKHSRVPRQYKVYIKSKYWERRKNRYYQKYGRRCAVCKSTKFIDLHHIVYGGYGNEPDQNLIPLCKDHHTAFHAQHGVARDMKESTACFIHGQAFEEEVQRTTRNL
jgi:hypothetical protein